MRKEPVSSRIIQRVADREGVDPVDVTPPLYESIDPDALDSLFHDTTGNGGQPACTVEFSYHGYTVTVDSTGTVDVSEPDAGSNQWKVEESIGD